MSRGHLVLDNSALAELSSQRSVSCPMRMIKFDEKENNSALQA